MIQREKKGETKRGEENASYKRVMKQSVKRMAVLIAAGALALTSLTGCTSFDNDDAVATVGKEEIPAGVANFYARMQQAQYETYYAPMMGTTGEALWQAGDGRGKDV